MAHLIFGTPIWEYHLPDSENLNRQLLQEMSACKSGLNLFDLQSEGIASLKNTVKNYAHQIGVEYRWKHLPDAIDGRKNPIPPGGSETPHFHLGSKLVAVYYVVIPPNSGDILLHDPRGYTNWDDPSIRTEDTGKSCRAYHRVTPVEGMLLMFPSYLVHSVEVNLSDRTRISIAINISEWGERAPHANRR